MEGHPHYGDEDDPLEGLPPEVVLETLPDERRRAAEQEAETRRITDFINGMNKICGQGKLRDHLDGGADFFDFSGLDPE